MTDSKWLAPSFAFAGVTVPKSPYMADQAAIFGTSVGGRHIRRGRSVLVFCMPCSPFSHPLSAARFFGKPVPAPRVGAFSLVCRLGEKQ